MTEYQVINRKYRPQRFSEVIGQEAITATLINAIRMEHVASAYLFCGSKGTGKTTIARIFAKALNCKNRNKSSEPCNACSSCKEITASASLDCLEIDGASHRGIEDVRQINETARYAPASSTYKIYLIDEVHMLTKEAFNALLKLLEEPSPHVKFLFATTEPHKIPATILSRCQRFNLHRIPLQKIEQKLAQIAAEMGVSIEQDALRVIAEHAGGGLRDGEVLLDQMISFYGTTITLKSVEELLGILPSARFAALDEAILSKNYTSVLDLAQEVVSSGRNVEYFIEELIQHFRASLLAKKTASANTQGYSEEIIVQILHILFESAQQIRFAFSQSTHLEMVLLNIVQCVHLPSIPTLVERLIDMEKRLTTEPQPQPVVEKKNEIKQKSRADTIMRFAAKELNGSLKLGEK